MPKVMVLPAAYQSSQGHFSVVGSDCRVFDVGSIWEVWFGSAFVETEAEGHAATFVIASGITAADATAIPQPAADDALVFTMPETTARRSTRRRPPTPTEYREEDLPF